MNTFRNTLGIHSFREARMLRMSPGDFSMPSEQPQPEAPREGDAVYNMRADQLPEETLRMLVELSNRAHQQTNETVEEEITKIQAMAQRDVDALATTPGASKQFIIDYVKDMNALLHPRLHIGMANGQVRISPYNPTVFAPEVIARKNRINELQGKINEVDRNIQELMRGFRQSAVQYRGQKGAAMNRGNIAPEINKFLMQFPQGSMQASAAPLNQLYAIKFQLQQELAGVKSGRIKVPVPVAGATEDPSLIMPARFAANATGDTRFNLDGAPGGIGPDGLPLQNALPTAAEQAQILRYTARWRNAKTQEERDTVEGFLMMDGVDVDGSNLKNDEIVMVSPEERGMQFLIGFITVLKSFLDRLAKKKTDVESVDVGEKDPSEMTLDEQTTEKEGNDKKLTDFKDQKTKAEGEIKEIDKKLKAAPPPDGEIKEKLETDLKNKKEEVKNIEEEIKKLEERNVALANPTKATEDEKNLTKKEPLQEGQAKLEALQEDPVIEHFERQSLRVKQEMIAHLDTMMRSGDFQDVMSSFSQAFGIDPSTINMSDLEKFVRPKMLQMVDLIHDMMSVEKNDKNQYRLRMDFGDFKKKISIISGDKPRAGDEMSREELEKMARKMNRAGGPPMTIEGTALVTDFMSGEKLMGLKI